MPTVRGGLTSTGDVTVADGAHVRSIEAGGTVLLRPGATVGDVRTDGLILIHGRDHERAVRAAGR